MAVVLITGCSSGFGRAAVRAFCDAGHSVVATARDPARAEDLLTLGSTVTVEPLDITDPASRSAAVLQALSRHGCIDILVNNAGIFALGPTEEIPEPVAREQFETNFWGAYGLIREVLPAMIGNRSGRIVNVTSVGALLTPGYYTMYCATKHALDALTLGLDIELQPFGIRCVSVAPGGYGTKIVDNRVPTEQANTRYPRAQAVIDTWQARMATVTDISPVVDAILEAATTDSPAPRYLVGEGLAQLAGPLAMEGERLHQALRARDADS